MRHFLVSVLAIAAVGVTAACGGAGASPAPAHPAASAPAKTELATVAGGCFWCTESAFDDLPGVIEAISGYTGGEKLNPTYEEVSAGGTGHFESVQIRFDPAKIS